MGAGALRIEFHGLIRLPTITERRDLQEHVLVASYQYEIPRASTLFGGNQVVGAILDNWRISGISTFGTGGRGDIDTVTYSPSLRVHRRRRELRHLQGRSAIRSCRAAIGASIAGSIPSAFAPLSGRGD